MITITHQEHPELPIQRLCELFGVSCSWYYEQLAAPRQDEEEIALRDEIEHIILTFPGYGYRRVTRALHRQGQIINHKRVLRIMREESVLRHSLPVYPNELTDLSLTAPDQAWVADLTSIRLRNAFVYLACILDAFSRRCVGWHLSHEMTTSLTLTALQQAVATRKPQPGLIHPSDRGVQYASHASIEHLQDIDACISMSSRRNPYDNAKAELFFKTLKHEEVYLKDYQTFADAQANLTIFIEQVYNQKRLHSSLGYRPPAEFEAIYASVAGS